ncbi:MAG: 2'-5' RNA ligase [Pseudohongiellaceae bacterium]|jgi:2'-5' RNA ligase
MGLDAGQARSFWLQRPIWVIDQRAWARKSAAIVTTRLSGQAGLLGAPPQRESLSPEAWPGLPKAPGRLSESPGARGLTPQEFTGGTFWGMITGVMPRLFVAVELPEPLKERLAALCHGVQGARWVTDGQFHITLSFLGSLEGPLARQLQQGLAGVRCDPFTLRLSGIGHFPPRGKPKVLWVGVEPHDELRQLKTRVDSQLKRLGITVEARRYAPHVTLARMSKPAMAPLLQYIGDHVAFETEEFAVADFQLFSSVLGRVSAVHRVEASYPLMGR